MSDSSNNEDINRVKRKFFIEFNSILRKFSICEAKVKLFLFKQYCLQFYGMDLWFGCSKSKQSCQQFAIAYHKAIKKLLGLSTHESNHFACQEGNLFIFDHFLNKTKLSLAVRFLTKRCVFIDKILDFFKISSVMINEVNKILSDMYQVNSLTDNDFDAILARIIFVQNNESQIRVSW